VRLALAATLLIVLGVFAGSASGRPQAVQFIAGPSRVVQGNEVSLTVAVSPAGAHCSLAVRYKSGARQKGLPSVTATGGRATWTWKVPRLVQPGPARVTASCAGAGRASRRLTVIGQVIPPHIQVVKTGWSVRNFAYGGSDVSYGLILKNESTTRDAQDVKVLVNFVMDDNRLIGSSTERVDDIAAGTEHALGGELFFQGGAPIARLEVVVEVGRSGPATHAKPGISAVRIVPDPLEPAWVGAVEGEVQNDHPRLTVGSVELTTVLLDADGRIIGGGSGFGVASLPPAARMFFKITNGMRPIAYGRAATALVSIIPRYNTTP
jgi:hypothetical protein